jgi:hypothetical protein
MIIEDTGCNLEDASIIEHIMRDDIFASTLDWQTRDQLRHAAREAFAILEEDRPLYVEYFARTRAFLKSMQSAAGQESRG